MIVLLKDVVAIGASVGYILVKSKSRHTFDVSFIDIDSSVTAVTAVLRGSIDGDNVNDADALWFALGTAVFNSAEITAKKGMFHVIDRLVKRVSIDLTVLTGEDGSTDLFTARYHEGEN